MATYGVGALLVIIGFVISFQFVEPAPPREIRIAAGASDGAYFRFAQAYGAELAREGIRLEVVETAGSVENLERMEQELEQVEVPLSYADQLYNLRLHVQLVRQRLRAAAS